VDTGGCVATDVRFVKMTDVGTNASFLPDETPCTPFRSEQSGGVFQVGWVAYVNLSLPNTGRMYITGDPLKVHRPAVLVDGFELSADCGAYFGFDSYEGMLSCGLTLTTSRELVESEVIDIIGIAVSERLESQPVLIYQAPDPLS
jgi:hypothetical protein